MSLKGSPMLNTPACGEHRAGYAKHPKNQNATWKLTIERPCSTAATSSLLLVSPCSPRLCSFSPFSLREATSYFRRCFTAVPRSRPRLRPAGPGGSRSSMPATSTALQKPAPSARGPLWPQQFLSPQSGSRHGGFISFKDCGWAEIIQYHHNRCVATFETSLLIPSQLYHVSVCSVSHLRACWLVLPYTFCPRLVLPRTSPPSRQRKSMGTLQRRREPSRRKKVNHGRMRNDTCTRDSLLCTILRV